MDDIYTRAAGAWNALETFRADRQRCKRYVFGDQWNDMIKVGDEEMPEREFIQMQGQNPLKNNILRRIVRNVVGVYRANFKYSESENDDIPGDEPRLNDITETRRVIFRKNKMEELAPRLLEEFLISGMAVVKVNKTGRRNKETSILPVTPDNFFFHSDGYDPRGWDVDMAGEVHYVSYDNIMAKLCRDAEDYQKIDALYGSYNENNQSCKVIEVWYRDTEVWGIIHDERSATVSRMPMSDIFSKKDKYSSAIKGGNIRSQVVSGWRCAWYAYDGTLLKSDEISDKHPYVCKVYPFLDGEVHSYISDVIDQQRYVNHLITLYDFIMKSSAKGVLLFPDESIPRGWTMMEVAEAWSRFNGVIPYRAQPGVPLPTQVSGNAANIGITELLKIEMQMLEDISGVSPTLQGKLETNASSGTLFAQQNQAAMTSLLDVVRTFEEFVGEIFSLGEGDEMRNENWLRAAGEPDRSDEGDGRRG